MRSIRLKTVALLLLCSLEAARLSKPRTAQVVRLAG